MFHFQWAFKDKEQNTWDVSAHTSISVDSRDIEMKIVSDLGQKGT
jgi:hypothetical protein